MKAKDYLNDRLCNSNQKEFTRNELEEMLNEYYFEQFQTAKLYRKILSFIGKILAFPFFICLFVVGLSVKLCHLIGLYFLFGGEVVAYHNLMRKKTITDIYWKVYDTYKKSNN